MNIPEILPNIAKIAADEGWTISQQANGPFSGLFIIGNDAEQGRFECDVDAEQFVRYQAAQGSALHQMALKVHRNISVS